MLGQTLSKNTLNPSSFFVVDIARLLKLQRRILSENTKNSISCFMKDIDRWRHPRENWKKSLDSSQWFPGVRSLPFNKLSDSSRIQEKQKTINGEMDKWGTETEHMKWVWKILHAARCSTLDRSLNSGLLQPQAARRDFLTTFQASSLHRRKRRWRERVSFGSCK